MQKFHYCSYEILLPLHTGEGKKKGCNNTLPPEKLTMSSESCMQKHPGVHGDLAGVPCADGISLPVPPELLGCSAGALPAKLA